MINKATLLGRIGKKEYKSIKNDSFLCSISLATSKKYIDSQGKSKEKTNWHYVNFFNKLADIANRYAEVGDLIYIEGEICNRKIDDNGITRIVHSINATELKLLPGNKKRIDGTDKQDRISSDSIAFYDLVDDIPF